MFPALTYRMQAEGIRGHQKGVNLVPGTLRAGETSRHQEYLRNGNLRSGKDWKNRSGRV